MCVAWVLNPQPFAMLTQCSTTEPQEYSPLVPHPWFSLIATLVFVYSNSLLLYQYLNSSYLCRLCCYTLPCERKTKKKNRRAIAAINTPLPSLGPQGDGAVVFIFQNGGCLEDCFEEFLENCHFTCCNEVCLMEGFCYRLDEDIWFVMPRVNLC